MVSNHGGRQLDYSPATLDMIAPIRAAVGHRVPLLMDGGIRRGTDVLKVLLHSTAFLTDFCNPFLFCLQIVTILVVAVLTASALTFLLGLNYSACKTVHAMMAELVETANGW